MDRSWLSHSYQAPYARERGSFPRDKTWFTVIECGLIATIIFVIAIKFIL